MDERFKPFENNVVTHISEEVISESRKGMSTSFDNLQECQEKMLCNAIDELSGRLKPLLEINDNMDEGKLLDVINEILKGNKYIFISKVTEKKLSKYIKESKIPGYKEDSGDKLSEIFGIEITTNKYLEDDKIYAISKDQFGRAHQIASFLNIHHKD